MCKSDSQLELYFGWHQLIHMSLPDPEFVNISGAQESIPELFKRLQIYIRALGKAAIQRIVLEHSGFFQLIRNLFSRI
jgi:hypothetical protein